MIIKILKKVLKHLIDEIFRNHFAHWNISLPEENLKNRNSDFIQDSGWLIQYCFGENENCEFLDYYATHRMTGDSHVRIYSNGETESLPALCSMCRVSEDPTENKRFKKEFEEYNANVVKTLAEKGFDKFTINMFLVAGFDDK